MFKRKEYIIHLKNGLKVVIHKHDCSGETTQLFYTYYLGCKKLANFVRVTIRNLAKRLHISPVQLANFLEYDTTNIAVLSHIS